MKIWRWRCSRYLRNHGFLQREKFECLKFRHTDVIHKKLLFWVLLKCIIVSDIYEHVHHKIQDFIILEGNWPTVLFWGKIDYSHFCQSIARHDIKILKQKKALQRIIIRFSNFGPNSDNVRGFSLMRQEIGRSPALVKNLLILFPTTKKNPPISRHSHQSFIPLH